MGSEVRAIAKGKVRAAGPFYWGTFAIEIDHGEYGVGRYCEVTITQGIASGVTVKEGQVIAHVAQLVNPRKGGVNPHPMLHLEWYSGRGNGALTVRDTAGGVYQRRADLKDPTRMLYQFWSSSE